MISHSHHQAFVPRQGEACANRAVAAAARLPVFALVDEAICREAMRGGGAEKNMGRGAAATAAVTRSGPISVKRSEQDRCEGAGVHPGAFPRSRAQAWLCGTLCATLPGPSGDGRRRVGFARPL